MSPRISGLLVVALLALASRSLAADPPADNAVGDELIVHEWGTFTNFSGSDGVNLSFRPLVDNELPEFVVDRARQSGKIYFGKGYLGARQRMETPVTYFYTNREREVNVQVRFPEGLLTEFYPPVANMKPEFEYGKPEPIGDSVLDWGKVLLVPPARLNPPIESPEWSSLVHQHVLKSLAPDDPRGQHYFHARETDSAYVFVHRPAASQSGLVPAGTFSEKFLFYRGVGNFDLPLQLKSLGRDWFELFNTGKRPVQSLFLVSVKASSQGDSIRFREFASIGAGERLSLELPANGSSAEGLSEALVQALVRHSLFEKEARAMVKTWESSWFRENGTRLLCMVPPELTDELLPLEIEPTPNQTVRILVGRLEVLTPEAENSLAGVVRESATLRTSPSQAYEMPAAIRQLGRLAEPALLRVKSISGDPAVAAEVDLLLAELRPIQPGPNGTEPLPNTAVD